MQSKRQMIIKQSNKERHWLKILDTGIFQFKQNDPKHSKKVSSYAKTLSLKVIKTEILGNGRYKFIVRIIDEHTEYQAIIESKEDLQRLFRLLGNRCVVLGLQQSVTSFKKIGEGSFAQVYEAITSYHSKYALKCFEKKGLHQNQKTKKGYLNQIQIMKRLNSPYIVSFDYIFQTQKAFYLKMEYFQKTLKQKIAGKLLINSQKTFLKQLLMGLLELKSKGIIHRDLKPDNIMIRKKQNGQQQCVIIDMGLATLVDSIPYLYVRCGTPGFLSPQIANLTNKKQKQGCASDMFSLGCIFYKMITGRYLFSGTTAKQVLQKNRKCQHSTIFDSLSLKQRDLLRKMIDPNPSIRITPQEALKHGYFDQDIDDCDEIAQQESLIAKNLKRIACSYPIKNMESVYNSFESINQHSMSSAIYKGKRPTLKDSCLTFQMGSNSNSIAEDFLARRQSLVSPKSSRTPEKGFRQSRFSKMCVL